MSSAFTCPLRARSGIPLSDQTETNLELDLKLVDLPILDEATRFDQFEPVKVLEGLIGTANGVLDGIFHRRRRHANQLNELVCLILHNHPSMYWRFFSPRAYP